MVDFSSELFGLSTLWLPEDFYQKYTVVPEWWGHKAKNEQKPRRQLKLIANGLMEIRGHFLIISAIQCVVFGNIAQLEIRTVLN